MQRCEDTSRTVPILGKLLSILEIRIIFGSFERLFSKTLKLRVELEFLLRMGKKCSLS
jgi:hypothetical protein